MAKRNTTPQSGTVRNAIIIPFPRYRQAKPNRRSPGIPSTPDFDAGFEFAIMMINSLKEHGLLRGGLAR